MKDLCCFPRRRKNHLGYFDAADIGDVTTVVHAGIGGALEKIQDDILRGVIIEEARKMQALQERAGQENPIQPNDAYLARSDTTLSRESTLLSAAIADRKSVDIGSEFEEELAKIKGKYPSGKVLRSRESTDLSDFFKALELQAKEARRLVRSASSKTNTFSMFSDPTPKFNRARIVKVNHQSREVLLAGKPNNFMRKERPLMVSSREVKRYQNASREEREELSNQEPSPRPIQVSSFNGKRSPVPLDLQTFATRTEAMSLSSSEDEDDRQVRDVLQSARHKKLQLQSQQFSDSDEEEGAVPSEERTVATEDVLKSRTDVKNMGSFGTLGALSPHLRSVRARAGQLPKLSLDDKRMSNRSMQQSVAPSVQTHDTKFFNEMFDEDNKDLRDLFPEKDQP